MRSARGWMEEAWRLRRAGDLDGAAHAFDEARRAGADPQRVALELSYVFEAQGRHREARAELENARRGPDEKLAADARAALANLPARFWGELYADAIGWDRVVPTDSETAPMDLVPTLRLRALWRPFPDWAGADFNLYLYGQVTRDLASRSPSALGPAVVYADNYALLGAGALLRVWRNQLHLFAQIGPAIDLMDDGRPRVALDARAGLALVLASSGCFPDPHGDWKRPAFCGELYADTVYVSRFDDNVIAFARPRVGLHMFRTGPIAWQLLVEARATKDLHNDYWNNFAEAGLVHRWRVLSRFGLDAILGIHGGRYYGLSNVDPLPSSLWYVDARFILAVYATTDAFRH